jgi:beta-N-acetylhexosaminidase
MKGITGTLPLEEAAPGALAAGVDQLLVCHTAAVQHRAIDLLRGAVEAGRITPARLGEASRRVAALRRWAGPPPDPRVVRAALRTPGHLALAARLGSGSAGPSAGPDPTSA